MYGIHSPRMQVVVSHPQTESFMVSAFLWKQRIWEQQLQKLPSQKGAAIRREKPGLKGQILLTSGKTGRSSCQYFLCLKMEMVPVEVDKVLKCPDPFLNRFERGHHAQRLRIFWDLTHSFSCDTCRGIWGPSGNPPACFPTTS